MGFTASILAARIGCPLAPITLNRNFVALARQILHLGGLFQEQEQPLIFLVLLLFDSRVVRLPHVVGTDSPCQKVPQAQCMIVEVTQDGLALRRG